MIVAVVVATRDEDEPAAPPRAATPSPTATPSSSPAPTATARPEPRKRRELAIGITEPNANFVSAQQVAEPFERWRLELQTLRPKLYRLVLDWPALQPSRSRPPKMNVAIGGCMRTVPPCLPWDGVRGQLSALAARQQADPGHWQVLVVVTGTPDWAGGGCGNGRNAAPSDLAAYRQLIRTVNAEAAARGATLRYWSPWNEPNHPYFLAADCPREDVYARLARAMRSALGDGQQLVLGELAGLYRDTAAATPVRDFISRLPRDVVCSAKVWGQHAYVGGRDPVDDVAAALKPFGCRRQIWITETGARRAGCDRMAQRLRRWWRDPRVTAAFQYTLREDDGFPTGLVSTRLTRSFRTLALWQAWAAGKHPGRC